MGKLIIETELNSKKFDSQYNNLKSKLERDQKRLNSLMQIKAEGKGFAQGDIDSEIVKLQASIESTSNKMLDMRKKIQDVSNESNNMGNRTSFNFQKMANSLRTFAFSLVGIRTAYNLVSKASSAYLSQDTELAEKLKSVWVGLGSFLAPVLEMISDGLLRALGYLNVFIKALTGIDFLARANAKALNSQAKATGAAAQAQKELNRQVYDFDVVRVQQDSSSSGGGGGIGGLGGGSLFDIPDLDENIVRKLQNLAKWLRENWDLIKKVGAALLIAFGAVKIGKIIKNIASLLGTTGSGLIGLKGVLTALATIGVVAIGVSLLYTALTGRDLIEDLKNIRDGLKEVKEMTEANTQAEKGLTTQTDKLKEQVKKAIDEGKLTPDLLKTTTNMLENNTTAIGEQIKTIESQTIKTKAMREEEKALREQMKANIEIYDLLYQQGLLNEQETGNYKDAIAQLISIDRILGHDTKDLEKKYSDLEKQTSQNKNENNEVANSAQRINDKYKELTNKNWQVKLDTNTEMAEDKVTRFVRKLNDLVAAPFNFVVDLFSKDSSSSNTGRHFAYGGIVTQPTRALIGEAGYPEAVLPMTQDYLGTLAQQIAKAGGGSGTVNVYLDGRLIQRQTAERERQKNFLTNGR